MIKTALFSMSLWVFAHQVVHALPLQQLNLPEGFKIEIYADDVPNARQMALGDQGTLFVGTRRLGEVYALTDVNNDYKIDKKTVIAQGLNMPSGLAFKDGSLYVAAVNQILRFDKIEQNLDSPPKAQIVTDALPDKRSHGWKFIRFAPSGELFVPVGAPCNICETEGSIFATILSMNVTNGQYKVYARGIRNSVGFDWHPETAELWFTDNGRDYLGDDLPPEELNRAPKSGIHFGFPYYHGGIVPDPEFAKKRSADEFEPPAQKLPAHVAPLGMSFYQGSMFPKRYRNQIFIPEHGSWNRSSPVGYRVTLVELNEDQSVKDYQPFIDGWLQNGKPWGRPVAILTLPDGSMLISDDAAGVIYRVTYEKNDQVADLER